MNIVRDHSPNQGSRQGWKPDVIVFHIAEGTYPGSVTWMKNPQSQVSAHFILSKNGEVTQLVPLDKMAWCNGTSATPGDSRHYSLATNPIVKRRNANANFYTVSIECEGYYKDSHGALGPSQLAGAVQLVKHIVSEVKRIYGVEIPIDRQHIIGHYEVNPKTKPCCPGERFPFEEIIRKAKDVRYTVGFTDISTRAECEVIVKLVGEKGYKNHVVLPQKQTARYTAGFTDIATRKECEALASFIGGKGYINHYIMEQ